MITALTLLMAAVAAPAQTAGAAVPASGASAARAGPGGPVGPGHMGGRWGSGYTPGWALMTLEERREHQARMRDMTRLDDCRAYVQRHHEAMAARAKEQGRAMPARPRGDACGRVPR